MPALHQLLWLAEHLVPVLKLFSTGVHVGAHYHAAQGVALCRGGKTLSYSYIQKPSHPHPLCTDCPIPCSLEESSKLLLPNPESPSRFLPLQPWRRRPSESLHCSPVLHCLAPCPRSGETPDMLNCYGRKHFCKRKASSIAFLHTGQEH